MNPEMSPEDLVKMLDGMMSDGANHVKPNFVEDTERASKVFSTDVDDCPTCASIPNLTMDEDQE